MRELPYYNRKKVESSRLMKLLNCDWNERQVLSVVGGGGKTSFIYTLASELVESGLKTIVTTTTHMRVPEENEILLSAKNEINKQLSISGCALVGIHPFGRRMIGVEEELYHWMCSKADVVLVEADGAKRLPVKAPNLLHEPVIPKNTTYSIIVAGLLALGHPIQEVCFRLEEIAKILPQKNLAENLTEEDLAQILVKGYQAVVEKQSNGHPQCYFLNQADTEKTYEQALRVASYYPKQRFIAAKLQDKEEEKTPEEIFFELLRRKGTC